MPLMTAGQRGNYSSYAGAVKAAQRSAHTVGFFSTGLPLPFTSISLNADRRSWTFAFDPTGAAFYRIVLYGHQVGSVNVARGSLTWIYTPQMPTSTGYNQLLYQPSFPFYPPPLEVMEESTPAPTEVNQPFVTFQWYRDQPNVNIYEVDQLSGGLWEMIYRLTDSPARWVYTVVTPPLPDETVYDYRVVALNTGGAPVLDDVQQSTAVEFEKMIVTPPYVDETQVRVGYDNATQSLLIEA